MNILILEDERDKRKLIENEIHGMDVGAEITTASFFLDFMKHALKAAYDLIIADLMAPQFKDGEAIDLTDNIIEVLRAPDSFNLSTPVLALTRYDSKAEENFKGLNGKDISVVTFSEEKNDWKNSLRRKVTSCIPPETFDFVIVCALEKEVNGYINAGYSVGDAKNIQGLECREINVDEKKGVIVKLPRMGLVTCGITSTLAIDIFKPSLICMSGICAGINGKANIYDVIIPDICHQHDIGKWAESGLEPEFYNVQIDANVRIELSAVIASAEFKKEVLEGISYTRSQIPDDVETPEIRFKLAPASSGSAVIANAEMAELIQSQHRKNTAFEMESFALYEAARLSRIQPKYFSAKVVVDDGSERKSDAFHDPACTISAKTVFNLVKRNIGFD